MAEHASHPRWTPRRAFQPLALGAWLSACSGGASAPDSPMGVAFPNQRPSFENQGRTLGYVSNGDSDSLSVVDLDGMVELGRVPVGLDPVGLDGPTHFAIDRARSILYLALAYPQTSSIGPHAAHEDVVRTGYIQALALSDLRPLGGLSVDPSPADVLLADDGGELLISHYDVDLAAELSDDIEARRAKLTLIAAPSELLTGAPQVRTLTVCAAPYGVAYGNDESRAYVACTGEDSLAVVDTLDARVSTRVPVGMPTGGVSKPYALTANRTRERLLVSNKVSRSVVLFVASDEPQAQWTTVFDAALPAIPYGVPYFAAWLSDSELVVPLQSPDGAALLDASTGAVTQSVGYSPEQCAAPREARVALDGRVFLVCTGDHFAPGAIVEVDPRTLAVTARVNVGVGPDRLLVVAP